jgi:hypothetical protein
MFSLLLGVAFFTALASTKSEFIPQHISFVCGDLDLYQISYPRRHYSVPESWFFYHNRTAHHWRRVNHLFPFLFFL